jgi:hypothetical protein
LTPQIFEHYGFVEPYPQRWIVFNRRLLFDVIEEVQDGRLKATFAIPPSPIGIEFLKNDIDRLEAFAQRMESEQPDIPNVEREGLLNYQQSILTAYKLAYEQSKDETLTDEVWYRERDYWWEEEVQQGANAASHAYHLDDEEEDEEGERDSMANARWSMQQQRRQQQQRYHPQFFHHDKRLARRHHPGHPHRQHQYHHHGYHHPSVPPNAYNSVDLDVRNQQYLKECMKESKDTEREGWASGELQTIIDSGER